MPPRQKVSEIVYDLVSEESTPSLEYSGLENHLEPRGLFVTGGEDGYVKVWSNDKSLIREICFPEPINTVCFLNPECDILVGHGPKVSIILSKDYRPFDS